MSTPYANSALARAWAERAGTLPPETDPFLAEPGIETAMPNLVPLPPAGKFTTSDDDTGGMPLTVACYVRGTRIATPSGETPIETLRIGDPVLNAAGAIRPIRWIGRRRHVAAATAAERSLRPIRIRAGALSDGLPRRDLLVSPQHALLLRARDTDLLVPAAALVNGASIVRTAGGEEVEYFHLELKAHDAIRAEGQPAESFVGDASRIKFDNAAEYAALYPKDTPAAPSYSAPRITSGPTLGRLRQAIETRCNLIAGDLLGHLDIIEPRQLAGWAIDSANPHCPVLLELLVDGERVSSSLADRYRGDLAQVSESGGYCGFIMELPPGFGIERRHVVTLRRAADRSVLRGAPVLVDFRGQPGETSALDRALSPPADIAARIRFLAEQISRLKAQRAAA